LDTTLQRNGNWALDILNVDSATGPAAAAIPEPGALSMTLAGVLLLLAMGARTRSRPGVAALAA
jgi:hypothetical protein